MKISKSIILVNLLLALLISSCTSSILEQKPSFINFFAKKEQKQSSKPSKRQIQSAIGIMFAKLTAQVQIAKLRLKNANQQFVEAVLLVQKNLKKMESTHRSKFLTVNDGFGNYSEQEYFSQAPITTRIGTPLISKAPQKKHVITIPAKFKSLFSSWN